MGRRANMERARMDVAQAIAELEPARNASCPNELAMRAAMALIRLNNAFESAGLRPLEIGIPFESPPETQREMFAEAAGEAESWA